MACNRCGSDNHTACWPEEYMTPAPKPLDADRLDLNYELAKHVIEHLGRVSSKSTRINYMLGVLDGVAEAVKKEQLAQAAEREVRLADGTLRTALLLLEQLPPSIVRDATMQEIRAALAPTEKNDADPA